MTDSLLALRKDRTCLIRITPMSDLEQELVVWALNILSKHVSADGTNILIWKVGNGGSFHAASEMFPKG